MWVKKEFPLVPSLEDGSPYAKRFTKCCLSHLLLARRCWLKEKMQEYNLDSARKVLEFVIRNIDYPFDRLGRPTDTHVYNAFSGKACYKITLDYWACSFETMMTYVLNSRLKNTHGYGDCEDSSLLATAMLEELGVEVYECFGEVYRGSQLLGGHAWTVAKLDGLWHLCEMTLDEPPPYPHGYPVIDPDTNTWVVENLKYVAWIKFNSKDYYEWEEESWMKSNSKFLMYIKMGKKEKHGKKKVKSIRKHYKAWLIKAGYIK